MKKVQAIHKVSNYLLSQEGKKLREHVMQNLCIEIGKEIYKQKFFKLIEENSKDKEYCGPFTNFIMTILVINPDVLREKFRKMYNDIYKDSMWGDNALTTSQVERIMKHVKKILLEEEVEVVNDNTKEILIQYTQRMQMCNYNQAEQMVDSYLSIINL